MRPDEGGPGAPAHRWAVRVAAAAAVLAAAGLLVSDLLGQLLQDAGVALHVSELRTAAGLVVVAAVHVELTRAAHRAGLITTGAEPGLLAPWIIAGALLVPALLASAVAGLVLVHHSWRVGGVVEPTGTPPRAGGLLVGTQPTGSLPVSVFRVGVFRVGVFRVASAVLVCHVAAAVIGLAPGEPAALVLGVAVAALVGLGSGLVEGALPGAGGPTGGSLAAYLAGLCLGALSAVVVPVNPWNLLLALPVLVMVQRAFDVRLLETAASTDGKTGLLNASAWQAAAAREVRRVVRTGGTVGLLIVDLDHFKAVNDAHGHLAGDEVLAAIADVLRSEVRKGDVVGRFGGEEFVVLLPDSSDRGGELHAVAERVRRRIDGLSVVARTPAGLSRISELSASVGGASCPDDGATVQQLLLAADAALHAAKHAGRNAVRLSAPERARVITFAGG